MNTDTVCPQTGAPCSYCSEITIRDIKRVGVISTGQIECRVQELRLGHWCNNDGQHFVRDLKECPKDLALAVPLVPYVPNELEWMRTKGG